jgi:hypothetical protein
MTMTICLFINLTNPSESPTPHAADTDGLPGHVWSSKQQIDRGRRRWRWPRLEGKRKATTVGWTGVVGARSGANPRQAAGTGKRRFRGDRWRIRPIGRRRGPKRPHRIASHPPTTRRRPDQEKRRRTDRVAPAARPACRFHFPYRVPRITNSSFDRRRDQLPAGVGSSRVDRRELQADRRLPSCASSQLCKQNTQY